MVVSIFFITRFLAWLAIYFLTSFSLARLEIEESLELTLFFSARLITLRSIVGFYWIPTYEILAIEIFFWDFKFIVVPFLVKLDS